MAPSRTKNTLTQEDISRKKAEMVLKVTKEVVVKFIEMGKVTPTSFDSVFHTVFTAVNKEVSSIWGEKVSPKR